jgi:hypothetical protein
MLPKTQRGTIFLEHILNTSGALELLLPQDFKCLSFCKKNTDDTNIYMVSFCVWHKTPLICLRILATDLQFLISGISIRHRLLWKAVQYKIILGRYDRWLGSKKLIFVQFTTTASMTATRIIVYLKTAKLNNSYALNYSTECSSEKITSWTKRDVALQPS